MHSLKASKLSGSLLAEMIRFTIPLLLTNLFQQVFNITDQMIAGRFAGELTLAAIGATTHLTSMLINLLIGVSVGVSTVLAQMQGEGHRLTIHRAVHTSIATAIAGGLIFGVLGLLLCRPLLIVMETPAQILDSSAVYMKIYFSGFLFVAIYNFGAAILRAKGDTKRPLWYLSVSGAIRVCLNLVFVVFLDGGPAAIAVSTVISNFIAAFLVIRALQKENDPFRLYLKKIRIFSPELRRILFTGIPIGMQSCILGFSNVILQSSINSFGEIPVAGVAAANNYNSIYYAALTTMSHTATIFCGRSYGAKKHKDITRTLVICCIMVLVVGGIIAGICLPFVPTLVSLFVKDPVAIQSGAEVVLVLCLTYSLSGLMEVFSGGLRAINKSVYAMVSTTLGLCITRILWIYTYFQSHRSLGILYYSYPLSWLITLIINLVLFLLFFRACKRK